MAYKQDIPVADLRQLIRLDTETGLLYWLPRGPEWFTDGGHTAEHSARSWNARYAGTRALACPDSDGYLRGYIAGKTYGAARVVFALHYGRWPLGEVDHRDMDIVNNRPDNLRDATQAENRRNVGVRYRVNRTSTFCGVKRNGRKWSAAANDRDGQTRHLGTFATEAEAALAYDAAARAWHGEFARLNFPD